MKKELKKVLALGLVGVLAFSLSACGNNANANGEADNSPAAATPNKKEYRFVVVPKVVHPWFDEVNKGAVEQAKILEAELGVPVKIDYMAPTSADVTAQNTILEQAAATRPDGIAVDPLDPVGSRQVFNEIRKQGIPIVVFDSPPIEGAGITGIGNDFVEQGAIAAEYLVELLGGKGKVAVMQGFPTAPNHIQRYEAQISILEKYPDITIVDGGIDNDDIQTAQQQAAAVLAANPDLSGYLVCDAAGPVGVAAAIKEAGKQGKVLCVGMDNLKSILEVVKDGTLQATSSTIPKMQGSMSILMLWQASLGVSIPEKIDTGILVIDKDNVDKYLAEQD